MEDCLSSTYGFRQWNCAIKKNYSETKLFRDASIVDAERERILLVNLIYKLETWDTQPSETVVKSYLDTNLLLDPGFAN